MRLLFLTCLSIFLTLVISTFFQVHKNKILKCNHAAMETCLGAEKIKYLLHSTLMFKLTQLPKNLRTEESDILMKKNGRKNRTKSSQSQCDTICVCTSLNMYFVEKIMYQKIFSFEIHGNKTQKVFID